MKRAVPDMDQVPKEEPAPESAWGNEAAEIHDTYRRKCGHQLINHPLPNLTRCKMEEAGIDPDTYDVCVTPADFNPFSKLTEE
jgi:hypothetical protein